MIDADALLETYNPDWPGGATQLVEDYRRFQEYHENFPSEPARSIADALDIPQQRIDGWLYDDQTPVVVKKLEIAEARGWIDCDINESPGQELAILTIASHTGGSIHAEQYHPVWRPSTKYGRTIIIDAIKGLDLPVRVRDRPGDRNDEIGPSKHGSLLGRALVAIGAPPSGAEPEPLPDEFIDAGKEIRRRLAALYIVESGVFYEERDAVGVPFLKQSPVYRDRFAELFRSVTEAPVRVGNESVTISAAAAEDLGLHELLS